MDIAVQVLREELVTGEVRLIGRCRVDMSPLTAIPESRDPSRHSSLLTKPKRS